ncbi:cell division ATP-binding protein FtsE [Candidatus Roizmanbacteria bacterium RIFOXYB2_FULL_38_10]|uniref:Cell division ATP-binding protein FtsE n=1 Tax=Candidatus Roizmanbacteria bacterium RIFOXYD1_FULL_38_12 TaxID=1802093 RepID=A0A1F7L2I0_9BACT|nr:MAG: cell division ATP-binding protein FtsE [Candidatus Roizmanbacteria bacterium RIFOXYA2_FULL_38_14]OGK64318.1 MAG: cell division ATP-binding protein FtsE [Candidatus Roizmanbacteria bacterium RIFOXYA1_FULL_37_12]OGK66164.1 MAG: cell division ATP-binding protein FtsE [Candidatus Roizmanbacteria bacterium RIFOXYB1_FULL_40_23]OGK68829.1 MAG: cell division ATP-binding protein FtsE [Candidatus Roizmanbacteria bacterium RIFOXYB2_FULL_38_10]OGK69467.1 MAG: cell division ATP-binding protein FtsE 
MIVFENVIKKFPLGNIALQDVSFEIEDNEFVFLVGSSGAGKTTILKLILQDTLPTSGTVMVNEFDVSSKKFHHTEKLRRNIGFVFQDFKILPEKNIYENIAISLQIMGISAKEVKNKVKDALDLVGLNHKEKVFPVQLSAGELQRVAIARAICGDRKIILADEPTGNLDPKTTWDIIKIFKKIEGKKTIIIATHNTDIVNSLKKRVLILKEGRLIKDIRKGGYEL